MRGMLKQSVKVQTRLTQKENDKKDASPVLFTSTLEDSR